MRKWLWTGKLSLPVLLALNINNLLAWFRKGINSQEAMKGRLRRGYNAEFSPQVREYDQVGEAHFSKVARKLLSRVCLNGKELLDVGCGTGILPLLALQEGASRVVCGDPSEYMLGECERKIKSSTCNHDHADFRELDAGALPFADESFEVVATSMVFGLVPDQEKMISEMVRVLRKGGQLALSAHGPTHYWEACDAILRIIMRRMFIYVLGYRFEFWPRKAGEVESLLQQAGLINVSAQRETWEDAYEDGALLYDFFAATSSSWWHERYPERHRDREILVSREGFKERGIKEITSDVIFAYGRKPS